MKSIFKICKVGTCSISVTGLELDDHQYSTVLTDRQGVFRYTDTVSINMLEALNSNEEVIGMTYDIHEHQAEDIEDKSILTFTRDGVYRIHHIVLPTLDWFNECRELGFDLSGYKEIYLYADGNVYKYQDGNFINFPIDQIPFINQCIPSTLVYDLQYTFSSQQLQECYYKNCREYFDNICNRCTEDSQYVRNRDIIWMAINIIRYLLDLGRLFEAQKIVEKMHKCTGLCYNTKTNITSTNVGCGCSK